MSSYASRAVNPATGELEPALFIDDYFGSHQYGVRFADGKTHSRREVKEVTEPRLTNEEQIEAFRTLSEPGEFPGFEATQKGP
jgi:hypothetical protein